MDKEQIIKDWTYKSLNNKTDDMLSLKLAIFCQIFISNLGIWIKILSGNK